MVPDRFDNGSGRVLRPSGHPLLHDRAGGRRIRPRPRHALANGTREAGTEIELGRKQIRRNAPAFKDAPHRSVAYEVDLMAMIAQPHGGGHEWLQIAAGARRGDHHDATHDLCRIPGVAFASGT
jgi:hypothetical protein